MPKIILNGKIYSGNNIVSESGKIKLDENSSLNYLNNLITSNLIIENNKIDVINLKNLISSITELNYVKGVTSSIQGQLDAINSIGNFIGTSDNYSKIIIDYPNATTNSFVIVLSDETHGNISTIYMYNGSIWNYVGDFIIELRNFSIDPINLETEVTGKLENININDSLINTINSKIDDCPDDGQFYIRKHGEWISVLIATKISDIQDLYVDDIQNKTIKQLCYK